MSPEAWPTNDLAAVAELEATVSEGIGLWSQFRVALEERQLCCHSHRKR